MMFFIVSNEFKYKTYFLANMLIVFFYISNSSSSLASFFSKFLYSYAVMMISLATETGLFFFIRQVIVDFDVAYSLLNSDRLFPEL